MGASVASVIVGPVEDHFGGFVVLPHLNICSEGASVVLCLSQVLLAGNKQEHGCILYLLVCLWSGFCQYEKLHLGQLVGLPSKLVSFFFYSLSLSDLHLQFALAVWAAWPWITALC